MRRKRFAWLDKSHNSPRGQEEVPPPRAREYLSPTRSYRGHASTSCKSAEWLKPGCMVVEPFALMIRGNSAACALAWEPTELEEFKLYKGAPAAGLQNLSQDFSPHFRVIFLVQIWRIMVPILNGNSKHVAYAGRKIQKSFLRIMSDLFILLI